MTDIPPKEKPDSSTRMSQCLNENKMIQNSLKNGLAVGAAGLLTPGGPIAGGAGFVLGYFGTSIPIVGYCMGREILEMESLKPNPTPNVKPQAAIPTLAKR